MNTIELVSRSSEKLSSTSQVTQINDQTSSSKVLKKPEERGFGMSKLSKEFYPVATPLELPAQGAAQSYISPFSPIAGFPYSQAIILPFAATDRCAFD